MACYGQKRPSSVYIDYAGNRHPIRILHRAVLAHQHRSMQIHRVASCHKSCMNHHNHQLRSSRAVLLTINTVLFKLEREWEKKNTLKWVFDRPTSTYRKTAGEGKLIKLWGISWGIWYKITHTLHYKHTHTLTIYTQHVDFIHLFSILLYCDGMEFHKWKQKCSISILKSPHTHSHTKWINLFFHQKKQRVEKQREHQAIWKL